MHLSLAKNKCILLQITTVLSNFAPVFETNEKTI